MKVPASSIDASTYFRLLGRDVPDSNNYSYMESHDATEKDDNGIPLDAAELSYKVADDLARAYDTEYEQTKTIFRQKGSVWQMMTLDVEGHPISVNLLQVIASANALRSVIKFTDEHPLIALTVFHALLVKHVWVFSHMCEAYHALQRVSQVRQHTGTQAIKDFNEFADTAAQALHHYMCRHA